ncbi:MAG: GlsB/YeaQ/YmgE family stress response membrane protein [Roseiflexaceae bacterium]|nr:GlsB/YeaQ/YmgE family stress response membrane protein [Roseiflexaceae bacterium]
MGLIATIIIGIAAGWITGKLMKGSGYGLWGDLGLGIIGSVVGGWIASLIFGVDMVTGINLTTLIVSVVGAVLVVVIARMIKGRTA